MEFEFDEVLDAKSGLIYDIYGTYECLDKVALRKASWGTHTDEEDHQFFDAEFRRLVVDFNMRERILIPYIVNLVHEDAGSAFRSILLFTAPRANYEMCANLWILIMERLKREGDVHAWPEINDFLRTNSGLVLQAEPVEPMPEKYEYSPAYLNW